MLDVRVLANYFDRRGLLMDILVCPHVSFVNPRSPKDAPPRESIETRSIVITRE